MDPTEKIKLVAFLRDELGSETPTFWNGSAYISYHPFDLVVKESGHPQMNWEMQIIYQKDIKHTIYANTFSQQFSYEITKVVEDLSYDMAQEWEEIIEEVVNHLYEEWHLILKHDEDPYERYDNAGPYAGESFSKWTWLDQDEDVNKENEVIPIISTSILIYVFDKREPVLVLESRELDYKYVYALRPGDTSYEQVIHTFLSELKEKE